MVVLLKFERSMTFLVLLKMYIFKNVQCTFKNIIDDTFNTIERELTRIYAKKFKSMNLLRQTVTYVKGSKGT